MLVKPNQTVLEGRVEAIRPEPDGWGAEVELRVERNESPSEDEDFLRPALGSVTKLFAAEPAALQVGDRVRAHARLLAGPRGGRAVIESVDRLADSQDDAQAESPAPPARDDADARPSPARSRRRSSR
jgi:hypothetical protein